MVLRVYNEFSQIRLSFRIKSYNRDIINQGVVKMNKEELLDYLKVILGDEAEAEVKAEGNSLILIFSNGNERKITVE